MGFFDRLLSTGQQLVEQAQSGELGAVTVESAIAPTFTIRPFPNDAGGGGGGFSVGALVGKLLRPRITVQTPTGPIVTAPYGDPPRFPWLGLVVGAGVLGAAAAAVYGVVRLVK